MPISEEKLRDCLGRMTKMLDCHRDLVNTCMVDFIVQDMFNLLLPEKLQQELLQLSDEQLIQLPSDLFRTTLEGSDYLNNLESLSETLHQLRELRMETLGLVDKIECQNEDNKFQHWDKIMPEKKTHEVEMMSHCVFSLSKQHNISSLVDLGSGKAYLSQVMNSVYKMPVLAIDSKETNTKGAVDREQKLKSKWKGLTVRASERAEGEEPSNRKSRVRVKADKEQAEEIEAGDHFVTLTKYVEQGSDIGDLVADHLPDHGDRVGVIGLHTCGDLAPSSIHTFLSSPRVTLLCNVGCCYNHLSPQGFPLSNYLQSRHYQLERSVKMLGVQPLDRLGQQAKMPNISLLWRAVMEVIFDQAKVSVDKRGVGRIAGKCNDFLEYVRRCEKKLCVDVQLSDEQIELLYKELREKFWCKLICFYQYRALFSLLIESIILTDRLLYLKEQKIENCSLVKLFDSNISPRCYAIIAIKKKQ